VLLASRAACQSAFVQQELGGAVYGGKRIIPIVWDMPSSDLPGWAAQYQAVDLRGATPQTLSAKINGLAKDIKADKNTGLLVAGAVLFWLVLSKG